MFLNTNTIFINMVDYSNPTAPPSSTPPKSIVGVFVPKASTNVLDTVKKQVETGGLVTTNAPVEVQKGYSRNIRTSRPNEQVASTVAAKINKDVGGQQLVVSRVTSSGVMVSQNPLSIQNPNVMRRIESDVASSGSIGYSTNKGIVVIGNPKDFEYKAVTSSFAKTNLVPTTSKSNELTPSNTMSFRQVSNPLSTDVMSLPAKLIYGEAAREVGTQASSLYGSINSKDIGTVSGKLLYQEQGKFIKAERDIANLETSDNIFSNIVGGVARLGLGLTEAVTTVPYTLVYGTGAVTEKALGAKTGVSDAAVFGTQFGLGASGIASTYKLGQDIGTYVVAGPVGLGQSVLTGAGIGLGTSTAAESLNLASGKKVSPEKIVATTVIGGIGGAIDVGTEVAGSKIGKVVSESKAFKSLSKSIAESRVANADININTNQFISNIGEGSAITKGEGVFYSKKLGVTGTIDSSARVSSLTSFETVGVGQTRVSMKVGGKQIRQSTPFEFTQSVIPGSEVNLVQGQFVTGAKEGVFTSAVRKSDVSSAVVYDKGIKQFLPSDQPLISIKTKGTTIEKPLAGIYDVSTRSDISTGGDIVKGIQEGLARSRGERTQVPVSMKTLEIELSPKVKTKVTSILPEEGFAPELFVITNKEPFKLTGEKVASTGRVYVVGEGEISVAPKLKVNKVVEYIDPYKNLPKDFVEVKEVKLTGSAGGGGKSEYINVSKNILEDEFTYGTTSKLKYSMPGDTPSIEVSKVLKENVGLFAPKINIPKGIGRLGYIGATQYKSSFLTPNTTGSKNILSDLGNLFSKGTPSEFVQIKPEPIIGYPPKNVEPNIPKSDVSIVYNDFNFFSSGTYKSDFSINIPQGIPTITAPFLGLPNLGGGGGSGEGAKGTKVKILGSVFDLLSITRRR